MLRLQQYTTAFYEARPKVAILSVGSRSGSGNSPGRPPRQPRDSRRVPAGHCERLAWRSRLPQGSLIVLRASVTLTDASKRWETQRAARPEIASAAARPGSCGLRLPTANAGRALEPHIVVEVRSADGQTLYRRPPESRKVLLAPAHVGAINDMLNSVVVFGTGRRAALPGHPAAGKTGTSQDFRDAWFVGFTAHFVAGVWVGNDDGRAMNKVMGGSLPARLWRCRRAED